MENSLNKNTHIDHTYDSSDWQYEEKQKTSNYTERSKKHFKRAFALGAASTTLLMLGGQKLLEPGKELVQTGLDTVQETINPQTVDKRQTDLKISPTALDGLVDHEIDFENYTEIELGDKSATITLKNGDVIRTTDRDYIKTNSIDDNRHTAILEMQEELEFKVDGKLYQDNETGYVVTNIDNFQQTASGESTGLKDQIDEDGWVAIQSPEISFDEE
ncbi:MAG: hypothetical protein KIG14_00590 [Candidatus Sacchiramonaceae bacterium]|nr:hypothetical protein [Candidatus Saccharimonadaceae bacterium]